MTKLFTTIGVLLAFSFSPAMALEDFRNWTNKDGNSIEAKFIKFKGDKIEIRRKDGFTFTLDPLNLSKVDHDYLKQLEKHKDSAGRVWNKGSYQQKLVSQKWYDSHKEDRTANFYEFKKDKIVNKLELVSRQEFEILKKIVQKQDLMIKNLQKNKSPKKVKKS